MSVEKFEAFLDQVVENLTKKSLIEPYETSKGFEGAVREEINILGGFEGEIAISDPHPHAFPDISLGIYGVEVKHTRKDTWRSVANSILESRRDNQVNFIYVIFGKMGGNPEVKWQLYDSAVIHVRTSHVPRFELEIGNKPSLFEQFGISYSEFSALEIEEKMKYIRTYAKGRLSEGQRLWWLGDIENAIDPNIKIYPDLPLDEKRKLRAEATVLCPQVCKNGGFRNKYYDVSTYLLLKHGVLAPQTRDLFTAGSVGAKGGRRGGNNLAHAIKDILPEILAAFDYLEDELFEEYWGYIPSRSERLNEWKRKADEFAAQGTAQTIWVPSEFLFG